VTASSFRLTLRRFSIIQMFSNGILVTEVTEDEQEVTEQSDFSVTSD